MLNTIIISVLTAKILVFEQPFKLPDKKPFNCIPCLSTWLFVVLGGIYTLLKNYTIVKEGFQFIALALICYLLGTLIIKFKI